MYSWSVSGTFNEVLIEIAEGYTIDTDPVVCGDEEECENLRKEKRQTIFPLIIAPIKHLRTESLKIGSGVFGRS